MIIVIDGPAGSGKSSTAKAVANRLGIEYLDSGALYRALTVIYLKAGKDSEKLFELLDEKEISFEYRDERFRVYLDGEEITDQLRSLEVAEHVSVVASMPASRSFVNDLMRKAVEQGRYIAEGRDLGSAVFLDADLKIYMSADIKERARRRYNELMRAGVETSLGEVEQSIAERDRKDTERKADPLRKAGDAVELDTTTMNFEQQVQFICSLITDKLELNKKQQP